MITEENCALKLTPKKVVSKEMPVFYNKVMKLNRDIAILLLKVWKKDNLRIADIMAGSGVRTIRFLQELPEKKIKHLWCNDISEKAYKAIKENIRLNKVRTDKIGLSKEEANIGLLNRKGFDYIEIDPFGTPNPYLDTAIKRLSRGGILAVTATDTSALTGTYPRACKKKYWAIPLKNSFMHETSLRILIRKVQLIGLQYEKPLMPVFCHASNHYVRIYLRLEKSKRRIDEILEQHKYIIWNKETFKTTTSALPHNKKDETIVIAGPCWTGKLYDKAIVKQMLAEVGTEDKDKDNNKNKFRKARKLLNTIKEEMQVDIVGSYDIHKISKKIKKNAPKIEQLFDLIRKKGYKVARTHTNPTGLKTTITSEKLFQLLRSLK